MSMEQTRNPEIKANWFLTAAKEIGGRIVFTTNGVGTFG